MSRPQPLARALFLGLLVLAASAVLPCRADEADGGATDRRRVFATAVQDFEAGRDDAAGRSFNQLLGDYAQLADYHLHFLAELHLRAGRLPQAKKALARLLSEHPRSVHVRSAALRLGKILLGERNFADAGRLLERAAVADDPAIAHAATLALGELSFRTGDVATAYERFTTVRSAAKGSEVARLAKEYLLTLRTQDPTLAPRGRAALEELDLLLIEGDYATALYLSDSLSRSTPELRPTLLRKRADALFGLGETDEAFAALWRIVDLEPRSGDAALALHRVATLLWNRDRDAAALQAFNRFRQNYPHHAKTVDAVYAIGRIYEAAGRITEAREAYASLLRSYPGNPLAGEARWRLGWLDYRAKDWMKAAESFAAMGERSSGREREAATYWRGRCHQRLGNSARAREFFAELVGSRSYYGMWASRRMQQLASGDLPPFSVRQIAGGATVRPQPSADPAPESVHPYHADRFHELAAAGTYELAHGELVAIEEAAGSEASVRRFLLSAYRSIDRHGDALRLQRALGGNAGLDAEERRQLLYPLAYWDDVRDHSHAHQIDPLLVLALMRQESLFDPQAHSPANAIGLLQLLPSTARRIGSELGTSGVDAASLIQPRLNITLGVAYLGNLVDLYGGDPFKATAAYNGGEAAVDKWNQRWPNAEADEWVEAISFRETRDYVKKVIGNYIEYRMIYG